MEMKWTTTRPIEEGFYYWQNNYLRIFSEGAVRVVHVRKYKNREGFACYTMMRVGEQNKPIFDCELGQEPAGRWAGPLPQPY